MVEWCVVQRGLPSGLTPTELLQRIGDHDGLTALVGRWASGGALVAISPVAEAASLADLDDVPQLGSAGLAALADLPDPAGFVGAGWFGVLGYQLGADIERLPPSPPRPRPAAALRMRYHDHLLRWNAESRRWWFESVHRPDRRAAVEASLSWVLERWSAHPPATAYACGPLRTTPSAARHRQVVAATLEHLRAGDIFQANLSVRLETDFSGDPLAAFLDGVRSLAPDYAAYVRTADGAVASLSPELFLSREGEHVVSSPIKGTAPLTEDPGVLAASTKNLAENTMIVDLVRNDLSRVALAGSVTVSPLRVEPLTGVWHLVRDVRAEVPASVATSTLVRAAFPPGSVTGAPKVRAMEIINDLETTGREAYTGAVGWVGIDRLELNVAIRTLEVEQGTMWLGVGGGIVVASDPDEEVLECVHKAAPLLQALGVPAVEEVLRARPTRRATTTTSEDAVLDDWSRRPSTPPPQGRRAVRRGLRVLLVDNYDSFVHNLARYCVELGAVTEVVRNDDADLVTGDLSAFDRVIVSPGPGRPEEAGHCVTVVRRAAGRVPLLGVCLGHQCIAEAFGARTVRAPEPVHGRATRLVHDGAGIYRGLPQLLVAGRYHSLVVDAASLPPVLVATAWTPSGLLMGVRHTRHRIEGTQIHPESVLTPHGHDLVVGFLASRANAGSRSRRTGHVRLEVT